MLSSEAVNFLAALDQIDGVEIGLAPPATMLSTMSAHMGRLDIKLYGQNVHEANHGAFTGEISATMLKDVGASGAIIGHSERRTLFHETDLDVQKKVDRCICEGFQVVLCIGETKEERESGETETVLAKQISVALENCFDKHFELITLAYEPVWAIGTGIAATIDMIQDAHQTIREEIKKISTREISKKIPILYGGSVTTENFPDIIKLQDVDGALVGGASLKSQSFNTLIHQGRIPT